MRQVGFIGLGKMGSNMVLHLKEQGIEVVAYNRTPTDLSTVQNVKDLLTHLSPPAGGPRVIWLMVPGSAVDELLDSLITSGLQKGDIVIDGGNSFYKDTIRRYDKLLKSGINYVDCGTSGGVEGARHGACLMLGGDKAVVESLVWLWDALAAGPASSFALRSQKNLDPSSVSFPTDHNQSTHEKVKPDKIFSLPAQDDQLTASPAESKPAWSYLGPSGAGHFVKMVHNGVEYGMDQAVAEGFAVLEKSPYKLDLPAVAQLWNHGSVVRGWLVELLAKALAEDPRLEKFTGQVGGGETGEWTVAAAKELGIEAEVIEEAVEAREKSKDHPTFATKIVSALRRAYGEHKEAKTG